MAHKTQEQRVISKIKEQGFITRNQCLSTFPAITRLGAIICSLKKEGWNFETENKNLDVRSFL